MNTSIQITKDTLEKLKRLKKIENATTYDDLINKLINKAHKIPDTMFGVDKGKIKKFSKEERIEFRDY
jgi:predicted CopG family antitoxin